MRLEDPENAQSVVRKKLGEDFGFEIYHTRLTDEFRAEAVEDRKDGGVESPFDEFKAAVPLVPLVLLYLAAPPLKLIEVEAWLLVDPSVPGATGLFDSRLTGAAMLIGAAVAALATLAATLGALTGGALAARLARTTSPA